MDVAVRAGVGQPNWVERAMAGDHDAFSVLVYRSAARLDATARLLLRDQELARDAVQETLIRAWRDLPRLRDPGAFDTWLYRLLVRASIDQARRKRASVAIDVDSVHAIQTADPASEVASRDEIDQALRRLTDDQRAVVVLRYYADLTVPEVASALDIPVGTAKSRLARAMEALHAVLDAEGRFDRGSRGGPRA